VIDGFPLLPLNFPLMRKAFTLIETLIVIAVFGTGILVVVYGISQTLAHQDRAKTQITASFLAREGIELMYNLRDSNYHKALAWNCIFQRVEGTSPSESDFCSSLFSSGTVLKLAMGSGNAYLHVEKMGGLSEDFDENFNNFQLFYLTGALGSTEGFQYVYSGNGGVPLRYARYILVKAVQDGGAVLPEDALLKIESHVLYKKGALVGDHVMESFIGNYGI